MDINVLKTFIAVCEYSGFSAAAEKLGYTQSTVSSQIRQLEKELDAVLFDRFYHKTTITSDGEKVLRYARRIVEEQQQLLSDLKAPEKIEGTIRLAMSSSVCNHYFREDFLRFKEQYPDIGLEITESGTEHMFDMLQKNEVDLVFTLDNHIYEPDYLICAEHEEKVHFIAARNHPIFDKKDLTLQEICKEPFILTEKNMSYRRMLSRELSLHSLRIHPILEIGNPIQICELVKNSHYLSFLPDFIIEDYVGSGKLQSIDVTDCSIKVWTQILIHRYKWKSRALSAFIDFYQGIMQK